jgi:peroxiredoxin
MRFLYSVFTILLLSAFAFAQQPKNAPAFTVNSLSGKTFKLEDLRGKAVVLNFWYTSCAPCIAETPNLNKLVDEYQNKEVVFLAMAMDSAVKLNQFLKNKPFKYEIIPRGLQALLFDYGDFDAKTKQYSLAFPTHVLINPQGQIELKVTGEKGLEQIRQSLAKMFGK